MIQTINIPAATELSALVTTLQNHTDKINAAATIAISADTSSYARNMIKEDISLLQSITGELYMTESLSMQCIDNHKTLCTKNHNELYERKSATVSSLHEAAMELYEYLREKGGEADFDELMRDLPELFEQFKASELHEYLSGLDLAKMWFFGFRLTDSEFNKLIGM